MDLFSHRYENKPENMDSYEKELLRLKVNCWVILFCLLEGQKLSAKDFMKGIKFKQMSSPLFMVEYRKRFAELADSGIELKSNRLSNGTVEKWIDESRLSEYRSIYLKHMPDTLNKLKKYDSPVTKD